MNRKVWLLLIIISSMVSTGCSRFIYDRADWFASWYVDDYIDFSRLQKKQFKHLVRQQHAWHRESELPRYKQFLQAQKDFFTGKDFAVNKEAQVTPQYMESMTDTFIGFWDDFMLEALPKMSDVLAQLTDEQVKELIGTLNKEQKEMEKKAEKETEQQVYAEREKEMQASIKRWFGKLDSNQNQKIAQWARSLTPVYDQALQHRRQWIVKLTQALKLRSDKDALSSQLKQLFVNPDRMWPDDYRQKMDENSQKTYALLATVAKSATKKQLAHLDKTLSKYIKDLDKLTKSR